MVLENFMILNPDKCHYTCLGKDVVSDLLNFAESNLKAMNLKLF